MIKVSTKAALLAATLFACNAQAEDSTTEPAFTYEFGVLNAGDGGRNNGDEVLRVVRREHTGKAIGLQVLTGVLAGGIGGVGFKKSQLHGEKVRDIPNPGRDLLLAEVRRRIEQWQASHPEQAPQEPVTVSLIGGDWVLLYQELDEEKTPYELRYRTSLTLKGPSRGFFKASKTYGSVECAPEPVVQGYEAWADAEFAGVKSARLAYVEQCAAQFAELIPTWLAVVPMREVPVTATATATAMAMATATAADAAEPGAESPSAAVEAPGDDAQAPIQDSLPAAPASGEG
ncbi:hypothetical protein [Stenotrophomonas sp. SY1]|uniref:hypothetical protein n=1 Tax=Stenotrophomonas sp. SY1 TaxID=477235 RepID=UPI001E2BAD2B|nr:hypothetical protein [Stenotrophomonas sp. SY1]MCD9088186.1 hypothetical protein [Stenotrophomonas sp. SY1]